MCLQAEVVFLIKNHLIITVLLHVGKNLLMWRDGKHVTGRIQQQKGCGTNENKR